MPRIHVAYDPFEEPVLTGDPAIAHDDMLYLPVGPPEPEPEQTPEQQRDSLFREAQSDENFSGGIWDRPARGQIRNASEVCVLGGWPRRHIYVGQHCPHGMLETMEMRKNDGPSD